MLSVNRDGVKSFLFILGTLYFRSLLNFVARISSIILDRSCKNGQFCLFADHRGKAFSVSSLNMMLAMVLF